jgi:anti-sigma regulatory factor (Ser/Thr protein kinase)
MYDNEQPLFSSLMKINYDKRFMGIARNFVENLSVLAGASRDESLRISLLIEECLAFIINKFIDRRLAAHIEICFMVTADKRVRIEITDIGPPIHESMIPSFDIANEDSEAGLWYKLVQELSDEFVFTNRFASGWLIQVTKNIENIAFSASGDGNEGKEYPVERVHASGETSIRSATAGDIPALIDLAYMTYRYSYLSMDFYDTQALKKLIDEKLYDIMVVEHGSKVIGACAIKYSDADHVSAEVGSGMVLPEYRDASAVRLLMRELNKYVQTNPRHCEFFMSAAVTSHTRSQKGLSRIGNGFKPLMVFLNAAPRPDFIGIDHETGGRESGLFVYHLNDRLKTTMLYITAVEHAEMIKELIAYTGNEIEVLTQFSEPEDRESRISATQVDSLNLAVISLESIGQDWFSSLSRRVFAAIVSGIEAVRVDIPASRPLPKDMERMLTDLNLVFCGLIPRSLERIDHAYCLSTKPVDFGLIKLHDPVAQKLLMHIEQNCVQAGVGDKN